MTGLTPKQERFAQEYLIDLNATQAAIRAGYSAKTAEAAASRLLRNVNVAEAVQQGIQAREQRTEITQDRVLKEYAKLAFLDIRKAFRPDGQLIPITEMDDETAAAINGLEVETLFEGRGEEREHIGRLHKIKLSDKKGALDSIARHLGMFTDKTEISGPDGGPIATKADVALTGNLESKSLDELTKLFAEKIRQH